MYFKRHSIISSSNRKLINLCNEYTHVADDARRRQKLGIILRELSAQLVCLSEQNVELMRKLEKQK